MELHDGSIAPVESVVEPTLNQEENIEAQAPVADAADDVCEVVEEKTTTEPLTKESILRRLRELAEAEDISSLTADDLSRLKQQFYFLHNNEIVARREEFIAAGNDPEAFSAGLDPAEDEFKALMQSLKARKALIREQQEARRLANLERKRAIIAEFASLAVDTDNINRHHQRAKELQAEFRSIGEVPPQNATDIWKEYQETVERFYDQAKINKELYDYDLKKNLGEKQLLISEARKLADEGDIIVAFRRLQELHDKWREIGPVAKEFREDIWTQFKEASTVINTRYQAFFEERKAHEHENEVAKTELCEQAEALDFSNLKSFQQWDEMTRTVIGLQEKWRTLGFASRKVNNQLFSRFREACDRFFAAKSEFYRETKEEFARNLALKTELCEQAEALSDSTDWRKTTDRILELQKRWREIGSVGRRHSDAIWKRFQKACDHFFDEKKKNTNDTRHAEQANLKAKRDLIEQLRALDADALEVTDQEVLAKVREAQAAWKEIGHVPFRDKEKVYDQFRAAVDALYARYDLRGQRSRMNSFVENLSEISGDRSMVSRERDRLLRTYEQRKSELQTYENNLGFLTSKSQSGNSMVREMERRVQRLKDDIAELAEKIKKVDEQA
ncbi:MAG: DUF349 domain-containing protein [Clostridium sp.]|nr:DUF349 domain-containing protein [Clostridium sp.]